MKFPIARKPSVVLVMAAVITIHKHTADTLQPIGRTLSSSPPLLSLSLSLSHSNMPRFGVRELHWSLCRRHWHRHRCSRCRCDLRDYHSMRYAGPPIHILYVLQACRYLRNMTSGYTLFPLRPVRATPFSVVILMLLWLLRRRCRSIVMRRNLMG